MEASFAKLKDGSWGLRIRFPESSGAPAPGSTVTVVRRDGSSDPKVIGSIVWQGRDDRAPGYKVALATIARAGNATAARSGASRRGSDFEGKECPRCGSEDLDSRLSCWECGYQGAA
jgi:hypothetical protein